VRCLASAPGSRPSAAGWTRRKGGSHDWRQRRSPSAWPCARRRRAAAGGVAREPRRAAAQHCSGAAVVYVPTGCFPGGSCSSPPPSLGAQVTGSSSCPPAPGLDDAEVHRSGSDSAAVCLNINILCCAAVPAVLATCSNRVNAAAWVPGGCGHVAITSTINGRQAHRAKKRRSTIETREARFDGAAGALRVPVPNEDMSRLAGALPSRLVAAPLPNGSALSALRG
jgi:hypothetical protein